MTSADFLTLYVQVTSAVTYTVLLAMWILPLELLSIELGIFFVVVYWKARSMSKQLQPCIKQRSPPHLIPSVVEALFSHGGRKRIEAISCAVRVVRGLPLSDLVASHHLTSSTELDC